MLGEISPLLQKFNANYLERYKEHDEKGAYFWDTMERSSTKTRPYIITAPDGTKLTGKWFRSEDTFKRDLETGEVRFLKKTDGWSVQFKQRLADGKKLRTLLEESNLTDKQYRSLSEELENIVGCSLGHPPKPLTLMKTLVNSVCKKDENDIVMDFFSGSATTAHAVMQLNAEDEGNRCFIMVQLPEMCDEKSEAFRLGYSNICEIGKERIRRAGKKLLVDANGKNDLDVGFKVFKLDTSNIKLWDDTLIEDSDIETLLNRMEGHINGLKSDRSNEDFIYEILLKMGYSLTINLSSYSIDGLTVYKAEDDNGKILICLQPGITAEHIEKMMDLSPQEVVLAESALVNNTAMSNAYYLLGNRGIKLKII